MARIAAAERRRLVFVARVLAMPAACRPFSTRGLPEESLDP
jgi:hypothetical protein